MASPLASLPCRKIRMLPLDGRADSDRSEPEGVGLDLGRGRRAGQERRGQHGARQHGEQGRGEERTIRFPGGHHGHLSIRRRTRSMSRIVIVVMRPTDRINDGSAVTRFPGRDLDREQFVDDLLLGQPRSLISSIGLFADHSQPRAVVTCFRTSTGTSRPQAKQPTWKPLRKFSADGTSTVPRYIALRLRHSPECRSFAQTSGPQGVCLKDLALGSPAPGSGIVPRPPVRLDYDSELALRLDQPTRFSPSQTAKG